MIYYYLLKPFNGLKSEITLCHYAPVSIDSSLYDKSLNVYLVYPYQSKWHYLKHDVIEHLNSSTYDYTTLHQIIQEAIGCSDTSFYLFMSPYEHEGAHEEIIKINHFNTQPAWRANVRLVSPFTSTSAQLEYPYGMSQANLTIITPVISRYANECSNYLHLVNLNKQPQKVEKSLAIHTTEGIKIDDRQVYTNDDNLIDLTPYLEQHDSLILSSIDIGGIPLYFSMSNDMHEMSLEHTHPGIENSLFGDRVHFQRQYKRWWYSYVH